MIIDSLISIDTPPIPNFNFPDSITVVDTIKIIDVTPPDGFNIFTLVNIIILIINLLVVLILNFYLFKRRRREDRFYQLESSLYKDLIIGNLKNFLRHSRQVEKILFEIIKSTEKSETRVKFIQEKFTEVEHTQDTFYAEELEVISAYKEELAINVKVETISFYDEVSRLWANMMTDESPDNQTLIKKFDEIRKLYYKKIITLVKQYQPEIESTKTNQRH